MPADLMHTIGANAAKIRQLHERIRETVKTRNRSDKDKATWQQACAEFHAQYDQLAFPGGYRGALDRIAAGDNQAIEAALCFVELRPFFFRSGYMYKDLLRKLKHAPLNSSGADRLNAALQAYRRYREQRLRAERA